MLITLMIILIKFKNVTRLHVQNLKSIVYFIYDVECTKDHKITLNIKYYRLSKYDVTFIQLHFTSNSQFY